MKICCVISVAFVHTVEVASAGNNVSKSRFYKPTQ